MPRVLTPLRAAAAMVGMSPKDAQAYAKQTRKLMRLEEEMNDLKPG